MAFPAINTSPVALEDLSNFVSVSPAHKNATGLTILASPTALSRHSYDSLNEAMTQPLLACSNLANVTIEVKQPDTIWPPHLAEVICRILSYALGPLVTKLKEHCVLNVDFEVSLSNTYPEGVKGRVLLSGAASQERLKAARKELRRDELP